MAENKASYLSSAHETVGKSRSGNSTESQLPIALKQLPDPSDRFELKSKIGEGTYGAVYCAQDRSTQQLVAIKQVKRAHDLIEEIEVELAILEGLVHENLPKFYGAFLSRQATDNVLWFAIELCSYGSVSSIAKHLVRAGTRFNDAQISYILHETLQALQFLHSHNVIHRDVKGKNVLLTDTCHVKLIDFGISRRMNSASMVYTSIGTPYWIAPEVILCGDTQMQREGYDTRADIWGVGILTFELVTGNSPYAGVSVPRALKRITQEEPPILQNVEAELSCFAAACLTKDFHLRPNASSLLSTPFLAEQTANKEAIRQQLGAICQRLKQEQLTETDRELTKVWHLRTDSCKNIENAQVHIGKRPQQEPVAQPSDEARKQEAAKKRQELNVDDLSKLGVLDETNMLASLSLRFGLQSIYTYVGDILVALNPLTPLPIYNQNVADKYMQMVVEIGAHRRNILVPHIYAVALRAYEAMTHHQNHQCIVINGESGAGKTESAKHTVAHLVRLGSVQNKNLEERILQTSPLLEAFGNAKTIIHQNSSRFGKYLEMIFSGTGKILGARMSQYLLEKSRVVRLAKDEGTFHIFYYLFDAFCLKDRALATFNLDAYVAYRYLGGLNRVMSTKQREENFWRFQTVKRCLETVGFSEQDSQAMFAAIAAIIHAGNLNFEQIDVGSSCSSACKIENRYLLSVVSTLLAIDAQELSDALTTTTITARTETIIRQNNVEEAQAVRDALAKTLYSRLFTWIVRQINEMLKPTKPFFLVNSKNSANFDEALEETDSAEASHDCTLIGILDIFGFENFPTNSFEQLCINITNEQLQYYFNQHIFTQEIEEMRSEGVQMETEISFTDNRPVLDMLLGKPLGILNLVDEESNFPKASDVSLVQKLGRNINNEYLSRSKSDNTLFFAVNHYAGRVEYSAAGFIEKNRDWLPFQLSEVMRRSEIPLIKALFTSSVMRSVSEHVMPQTGHPMHPAEGFTSTFTSGIPSAISTPSIAFTSGIQSTASSVLASKLHSGQSSVGSYSVASRVSQSRAQQTMASYFRNSLIDLLTKMIACQPHFVRCIRPNLNNEVRVFDDQHVLRQLRHCGLLETIRIRQKGFSHRFTYYDFVEKYRVLLLPSRNFHDALGLGDFGFDNENSYKRFAQMIVDRIQLKNYRLGKTKLFLKHFHIATLMERFETIQRKIVTIQALVRGFLQRRRLVRSLNERGKKAIKVQQAVRGYLARKHYRDLHERRAKAGVIITKCVRGYLVHKHYVEMLEDRLVETQWQMRASRRQRVRNSVRPEEERNHLLSALANSTLFLRSRFARESLKKINPRARQPTKLEPVKELVSVGSMDMYNLISASRRNRRTSVRCYKHTGLARGVNAQYYNTIAELKRQSCPSVAFNAGCKAAAGSTNQSTSSSGVFSNATNSNSLPLRLATISEERGERAESMTVAQKDELIQRNLLAVLAAKMLLSNKPVTRVNADSSSPHDDKTCLEVLLNCDKQVYPPVLSLISRDANKHHDNASSSDDLSNLHLRRQNTVKQHEEHEHEHSHAHAHEHENSKSNASHHPADQKANRDLFAEPPGDTAPFLNFVPSHADLAECDGEEDIDSFIDCAFNFDEDYRRINEQNIAG